MSEVPIYLEYFKNWWGKFEQSFIALSTKYAEDLNNDADLFREDIKGFIDVILQIQGEELKRYYCDCNGIQNVDNIHNLHKFIREELQAYMIPANMTYSYFNTEIDLYVNGKLIDFYIYVNAEPILYRFAKDRSQVFSLEQELLNVPTIHNTNENIILIDYLIHRMRMATEYKKRKGQKKILKSTLFEAVGADSWKKRYNAEYRTRVILNYWAEKGFGKGFKEEDDCFILRA